MVMLRDTNPDLYSKNIEKIFFRALGKKEEIYSKIFNIVNIEDKYIVMSGVTGLGILSKKDEGAEYTADELLQLYDKTFTPDTYGGVVRASKEAIEDDRSGKLDQIPQIFGDAMRVTIETSAAQIFDRSQTDTGADGVVLASTAHPLNPNTGSTYSNRPTNNVDLTITSLEDAVSAMIATPNERNITVGYMPRYLLVAPANKINAEKLLGSQQVPGGGDNDKNIISTYGIQIIVNPYLTDTDAWHLISEKDEHQLIFVWRKRPGFSTATDDLTDDGLYKGNARWIPGWLDGRGYYGTLGA